MISASLHGISSYVHVLRLLTCPLLTALSFDVPLLTSMAYFDFGMKRCGICRVMYGTEHSWGELKMYENGPQASGWMHCIPTCERCTHFCDNSHRFFDFARDSDHPVSAFYGGYTEPSKSSNEWVPRAPVQKPY